MNPTTGTFISMDAYSGTTDNPVSQHKYLYANANPVMYEDPSGYNSMLESLMSMSMSQILIGCSMIGSAFGYADAVLGGGNFFWGIIKGALLGLGFGMAFWMILHGSALASFIGTVHNVIATVIYGFAAVESFSRGNNAQGIIRGIIASITGLASAIGILRGCGLLELSNCTSAENIHSLAQSGLDALNDNQGCVGSEGSTAIIYSPVNPGPLPENVANTFNGATYTERILTEDTVMYRVSGGVANEVGAYMSMTQQGGGLQSQLDLALNPAWGNTAENVTIVVVPQGTTIYEGVAAPQNIFDSVGNVVGTLPGGGNQIYIPTIETEWFQ